MIRGPLRVSMFYFPKVLYLLFFSYYFGGSASYLLEITVPICLESILTQTRMGVGWVALPSKGHMRGQYMNICFMEKSQSFYKFSFYTEYFWGLSPYFLDMITLISVTQNRMGVG